MMKDTVVRKLYLLQLSTTTVPLPTGPQYMGSACYLVETADGQYVLIDSGMAEDAMMAPGRPSSENKKNVLQHLAELELRAEDIDIVICTHFDVDHAGYHDSFTNAEFIVQREHYERARAGSPRLDRARAHWDHPELRYRMVDGDNELFPGITLLETSGHVLGHQSVLVDLPKTGAVLLTIDAVLLGQLWAAERKAWPMDESEEQLRASTQKLMDIAERDHVQLTIFGHDAEQWRALKRAPDYYE